MNSFIANVNLLAQYIEEMKALNSSLDSEKIETLLELSRINVEAIARDLSKDTYLGNKQISIDLFTNYFEYDEDMLEKDLIELYNNPANLVRYESIEVLFSNNDIKKLTFNQEGADSYVLTNEELFTQLTSLMTVENGITGTNIILAPSTVTDYKVIIVDEDGTYSNVSKVTLHAVADDPYKAQVIGFAWADYTSALQLAATHIEELMHIADNLNELLSIPGAIEALVEIANGTLNDIQNTYLYVLSAESYIRSSIDTIAANVEIINNQIQEVEEDIQQATSLVVSAQSASNLATEAADAAKESEVNAKASENASKVSEGNAKDSEDLAYTYLQEIRTLEEGIDVDLDTIINAKVSAESSAASASLSASSATSASTLANSKASEAVSAASIATSKALEASQSASNAAASKDYILQAEINVRASEANCETSEVNAKESEDRAKQYRDETEAMTSAGITAATTSKLGGVKIGSGINVESDGTISVAEYSVGSATEKGVLQLSDSISTVSSVNGGIAATPSAVKSAYDKGVEGVTKSNQVSSTLSNYMVTTDNTIQGLSTDKVTLLQVQAEIAKLVDSSPSTLDTLNELAAALGDDPNYATTMTNQLTAMNQSIGVVTSTANSANTIAGNALPKSGGTLTGNLGLPSLTLDNVEINIVQDGDRKKMTFTF